MSSSRNSKENLKNDLDQVRAQIQHQTNLINLLFEAQENHGHDMSRDISEASNHLNRLKGEEAKLEHELMNNHGVSYYKLF